jgi:hypothetical protein
VYHWPVHSCRHCTYVVYAHVNAHIDGRPAHLMTSLMRGNFVDALKPCISASRAVFLLLMRGFSALLTSRWSKKSCSHCSNTCSDWPDCRTASVRAHTRTHSRPHYFTGALYHHHPPPPPPTTTAVAVAAAAAAATVAAAASAAVAAVIYSADAGWLALHCRCDGTQHCSCPVSVYSVPSNQPDTALLVRCEQMGR